MIIAEFACVECGADITAGAARAGCPGRCGICDWLDGMPDPRDRDDLRRQMLRIGLIGPVQ